MNQQTKHAPSRPKAPYLVIEVGGPVSGMVVCDCQSKHGAILARSAWLRMNKGQDYRIVEQGQREEAA